MKKFTKYVIALLLLSMALSIVPAASAAEYKGEPGKTVQVSFQTSNIMGIDGTVTVDDPAGIVDSSKIVKIESALVNNINGNTFFSYGGSATSWKLTYEVKLKASAPEGASCTVTISFAVSDANADYIDGLSKSHTIVVDIPEPTQPKPTEPQPTEPKPTEPQPTEPKPTEPQPTEPKPTEPKPTEPKPTEPKPTTPPATVDTSKLKEAIAKAEALNAADYTADSWSALQSALQNAKNALYSGNQNTIDSALANLNKALAGLVEIDRSALLEAIEKVENFLNTDAISGKVRELLNGLEDAKKLLTSQDQEKIDQGAALLLQLLEELEKTIADETKIEEIIKEIEKIVEVAPKGPYCNISIHYVWPILFFISLALNLGMGALIVVYFVRRKKNQTDDTPLVDYDIGDDV